jgi:hypothetical protein
LWCQWCESRALHLEGVTYDAGSNWGFALLITLSVCGLFYVAGGVGFAHKTQGAEATLSAHPHFEYWKQVRNTGLSLSIYIYIAYIYVYAIPWWRLIVCQDRLGTSTRNCLSCNWILREWTPRMQVRGLVADGVVFTRAKIDEKRGGGSSPRGGDEGGLSEALVNDGDGGGTAAAVPAEGRREGGGDGSAGEDSDEDGLVE